MPSYYIKNDGSDNQSGLSDASAWATITKLNSINFSAGDNIFFKRGNTWVVTQNDNILTIRYNGSTNSPIIFSAYGNPLLNKPIITGRQSINGWDVSSNWIFDNSNVWYINTTLSNNIYGSNNRGRLWLNGTEVQKYPSNDVYTANSSTPWTHNGQRIYVYSLGNPTGYYNNMEAAAGTQFAMVYWESNYVSLSQLDIRGGGNSIQMYGDNCIIDNCNIGRDSGQSGIISASCNNLIISNNIFDTYESIMDTYNIANTEDAIKITGYCDNVLIYNNTFKNWSHVGLNIQSYDFEIIKNVKFYNNYLTAPDIDYGRGVAYQIDSSSYGLCTGNEYYNNYIYDCPTQNQISGSGLNFYNNIIDKVRGSSWKIDGGDGLNISTYYGNVNDNLIYNNIIINARDYGIDFPYSGVGYSYHNNQFKNNIVINSSLYQLYLPPSALGVFLENSFENNIFYKAGQNDVIFYGKMQSTSDRPMTVAEFNAKNHDTIGMTSGEVADTIINNIQVDPSFWGGSPFVYHLKTNSSAINAGIDVSLIYDKNGLLYANPPSIGAYEYFDSSIYFVKNDGNDSANGLSDVSAWATITKVNATTFAPGDAILFKCGNTWNLIDENLTGGLLIDNDGTSGNRITLSAYSTGLNPIIQTRHSIPGWDTSSNWTQNVSIWNKPFNSPYTYERIWINGSEVKRSATNASVNSSERWNITSSILYVYAPSNPATAYTSMEHSGNASIGFPFAITGDYVTVQNLDLRGGVQTLHIAGADNVIIENCSIGKDCVANALYIDDGGYGNANNGIVRNNTFDSDYKIQNTYYVDATTRPVNGIYIANGVNNWEIHNNTFIDWPHTALEIITTTLTTGYPVTNILFHDNAITAPDTDYGRGFGINGLTGTMSGVELYNNHIYNIPTRNQVGAPGVKIYNNVIDYVRGVDYFRTTEQLGGRGQGIYIYGAQSNDDPSGIQIDNNTISNCAGAGVFITYDGTVMKENNYIRNNILFNNGTDDTDYGQYYQLWLSYLIEPQTIGKHTFQNNLMYSPSTNDVVYYGHTNDSYLNQHYTVAEFNAYNGQFYNDVITNNAFGIPVFVDVSSANYLSRNYRLQAGSSAIHSGINVSLITDKDGSLWNNPPSIGAYEYSYTTPDSSTSFSSFFKLSNGQFLTYNGRYLYF